MAESAQVAAASDAVSGAAAAARVGRIGLGTVQFGLDYGISNPAGQVPRREAAAILDLAERAGVRWLDTAAAYGNAEEVLGSILAADAPFRIVTKTLPLKHGLEAVGARARQSVALLGRRPVDTLLVHAAGDLATAEGPALWRLLEGLRDESLFRRIGISAYAADQPLALARRYRPAVMQLPVSLLDQRCIADGTLQELKSRGIEIHVRSVFLQGLLLMSPDRLPPKLAHAGRQLADVQARLAQAGTSPLAAALAFALDRPEIDVVLVGVTKVGELEEIIRAASAPSPVLDWRACAFDDPVVLTPSLW